MWHVFYPNPVYFLVSVTSKLDIMDIMFLSNAGNFVQTKIQVNMFSECQWVYHLSDKTFATLQE